MAEQTLPTAPVFLRDRGTLYLAGIESLSAEMQMAMPRALAQGTVRPVGGHEPVPTRLRLISGTAAELGLSRVGLRAKFDRHGVHPLDEIETEEA